MTVTTTSRASAIGIATQIPVSPSRSGRRNVSGYCIHSHTAAARAKGMTEAQHGELVAIVGLAGQTNHLVTAMQIPVDPEFDVKT